MTLYGSRGQEINADIKKYFSFPSSVLCYDLCSSSSRSIQSSLFSIFDGRSILSYHDFLLPLIMMIRHYVCNLSETVFFFCRSFSSTILPFIKRKRFFIRRANKQLSNELKNKNYLIFNCLLDMFNFQWKECSFNKYFIMYFSVIFIDYLFVIYLIDNDKTISILNWIEYPYI
jgi:hypothetical protein